MASDSARCSRFRWSRSETLLVLGDGRLLVANDNNYPGGNGRVPGTPDDTEMIILSTVAAGTPPSTGPSASAPPTTGN